MITANEIESSEKKDVWPKVRTYPNTNSKVIHWLKNLRLIEQFPSGKWVVFTDDGSGNKFNLPENQTPIPGIQLVITAEDGEEFPRIVKGGATGNLYLALDDFHSVLVKTGPDGTASPGTLFSSTRYDPLPPNTVTTINVRDDEIEVVSVVEPVKFPHTLKSGVVLLKVGEAYRFSFPHNEVTFNDDHKTVLPKYDDICEAKEYIESVEADGGGV